MTTWKVANAVVRHLEATTPVYDVSEQGYSLYVSLVDGPFEGDVRRPLGCEPRVRNDVGGWAW